MRQGVNRGAVAPLLFAVEMQPDSLDIVEMVMALEEGLPPDQRWTDEQRQQLIREIGDKDDWDDDALAALVRKLGPRPSGQAGAAVKPEEPYFE